MPSSGQVESSCVRLVKLIVNKFSLFVLNQVGPKDLLKLNIFGGVLFLLPFLAKVESFLNFRFRILTQMIMFHYIMDDV